MVGRLIAVVKKEQEKEEVEEEGQEQEIMVVTMINDKSRSRYKSSVATRRLIYLR